MEKYLPFTVDYPTSFQLKILTLYVNLNNPFKKLIYFDVSKYSFLSLKGVI